VTLVRAAVGTFLAATCGLASAQGASPGEGDQRTLELLFGEQASVSVASAREEPRAEAPATVLVITERQIRERGYRDLMDVLHDVPGLDLSTYLDGDIPTSVLVRGIAADNNKIVVLRDGVPINLPATFFKFGRNVPLYDVERIEILYGPASVVYGSDAVSGVIQLITKDPSRRPTVEVEASGGAFDPLKGFDRPIFDGHVSLAQRLSQSLSVTAGVRTYDTNGPDLLEAYPHDFAATRQLPAPYTGRFEAPIHGHTADVTLHWHDLSIGASFTDHTWSSMLDKNPAPPFSALFLRNAVEHIRQFQAFARHETRAGAFDLRTIVKYDHFVLEPETAFRQLGSTSYAYAEEDSVRLDHRTSWSIRDNLTLTGGVRAQTFNVIPSDASLSAPVNTNGNLAAAGLAHLVFQRYGVFTLAEFTPARPLRLSAGLSYEYEGNAGEHKLLPRAGAVLGMFGGAAHLKALYGEGFSAAVPDLQYISFETPGAVAFVPNPALKGEHMRSVEVRYDHRVRDAVQFEIGAYYNRVTGLQQRVSLGPGTVNGNPFPAVFTTQNLGETWTSGGEALVRASLTRRVQVDASYALVYGRETLPTPAGGEQTYDLSKISHSKILAGVTVRPFWKIVADARFRWVSDIRTRPSNSQFQGGLMPGYYDVNLNIRAEDVLPGLDVHLLVENLTDNRYYTFSFSAESGTRPPRAPQPPFRFLLGATWRWGGTKAASTASEGS
jgi:outer membrane receptor protein involved in Fe transport